MRASPLPGMLKTLVLWNSRLCLRASLTRTPPSSKAMGWSLRCGVTPSSKEERVPGPGIEAPQCCGGQGQGTGRGYLLCCVNR